MISVKVDVKETGTRPEKIPARVDAGITKFLRQAGELLRADIIANRLNKPRTGGGKIGKKPGVGARARSGPPQYPQVLSVVSGTLRKSINYVVEQTATGAIMRIGTPLFYGEIWERKKGGMRQWLEPAVKDNTKKLEDKFGVVLTSEIEKTNG